MMDILHPSTPQDPMPTKICQLSPVLLVGADAAGAMANQLVAEVAMSQRPQRALPWMLTRFRFFLPLLPLLKHSVLSRAKVVRKAVNWTSR